MHPTTFAELGLSSKVLAAIEAAGYASPTPIQAQAIPIAVTGRDVLGIAQTGTGKTASFTLPMITRLETGRARARMPRSLILAPTRELAAQVAQSFEKYGANHKLSVALLIGGVSMDDQVRKLDRGVDVLIATPGRLLDHFARGRVMLMGVEILVIDEADRMLDMGFIPDIEKICKLLPPRRQTLFFSATMPPEITRLVDQFLKDPVRIEVARPATTAKTITQTFKFCDSLDDRDKRATLRELLHTLDVKNAIIFCNRKRDVAILLKSLVKHGFSAGAIHGDLDQTTRMATLDAFREGRIQLLAASDVAARGLDIPDVSHVFNYDVPWQADDYVHRIGRTGRAGKHGNSVTIVTPDDVKAMSAIGKLIDEEPKWIGEAPDAETMAEGMKRRGRGRRGASSDRGGRDARGKGDGRRERRSRDRGPRPQREAEIGSANGAEAEVADAPQHAHGGGEERSRPRREERPREGRREERRDGPRQGGRGEREAKPQAQQQKTRPQGRPHEEASPRKDEAAPRTGEARERKPVAFGLDENVPAFLRRPVRIAGR
ncbi:MAG TPA: DEAD/DEAH box helicase [Hyphomicrobiaceae bacterium]|nr:DEAD/DEAH box helicase [Hyphomicrobiaceae bacterium]